MSIKERDENQEIEISPKNVIDRLKSQLLSANLLTHQPLIKDYIKENQKEERKQFVVSLVHGTVPF